MTQCLLGFGRRTAATLNPRDPVAVRLAVPSIAPVHAS
jgi:hypothetical protein